MFKKIVYYGVNTACLWFYKKYALCFRQGQSTEEIKRQQQEKLLSILKANQETCYGKQYDFKKIKDAKAYKQAVPLSDYETYRPFVEQLANKEEPLLTQESLIAFEPTSGSTKAAKWIPYTKGLKQEFQWGIRPWIYNLYTYFKKVRWGQSYWSITPATYIQQKTPSGVPIGFEEDGEYFGVIEQYLMNLIFVEPKGVKEETDMERFYQKTVLALLKAKHLALISVWNPTYLLLLIEYLDNHAEDLLRALPAYRRRQIEVAVREKNYEKIWPQLTVISCWCDAHAAEYAKRVQQLFPHVYIQPKGLLSTESFVSFPLVGEKGAVISLYSHFFEFLPLDVQDKVEQEIEQKVKQEIEQKVEQEIKQEIEQKVEQEIEQKVEQEIEQKIEQKVGQKVKDKKEQILEKTLEETFGIEELEEGKTYEVIVTTSGGFYRYRTYDVVKVVGFKGKLPLVRFIGKNDKVCDLFGEKLHEAFVETCVEQLKANPTFYLVAPEKDHYVLYIQTEEKVIAEDFDALLRESFHYDYCRQLGQLKEACIFKLTGNPEKEYSEGCVKNGQRLGDIKPTHLSMKAGWDLLFIGHYIKS